MLATTEAPMPNIRPMPVQIMKSGATMLTAAIPSAPTPLPTKMPSIMVKAELNIIPISVGKNKARNSTPIFPSAKLSLSLSKFLFFIFEYF